MLKECNFYNFINLSTPFTSKIETKDNVVYLPYGTKNEKITLGQFVWNLATKSLCDFDTGGINHTPPPPHKSELYQPRPQGLQLLPPLWLSDISGTTTHTPRAANLAIVQGRNQYIWGTSYFDFDFIDLVIVNQHHGRRWNRIFECFSFPFSHQSIHSVTFMLL